MKGTMTAHCVTTTGICAGCGSTFPIKSKGELGKVCPDCNYPDVRDNYDMSEHEGKGHYSWAICTRCHEKIVYRGFYWKHGDYDEGDLPVPLFHLGEDTEEEGISLSWMGGLALLGLALAFW